MEVAAALLGRVTFARAAPREHADAMEVHRDKKHRILACAFSGVGPFDSITLQAPHVDQLILEFDRHRYLCAVELVGARTQKALAMRPPALDQHGELQLLSAPLGMVGWAQDVSEELFSFHEASEMVRVTIGSEEPSDAYWVDYNLGVGLAGSRLAALWVRLPAL